MITQYNSPWTYLCIVWFDRRVLTQFRVCVLIVDIVSDPNELLSTICAGDKRDSDTYSITLWNQTSVWGISLWDDTG